MQEQKFRRVGNLKLKAKAQSNWATMREHVIKRKISNGTRTDDGTKAWEVFLSLLDTCRKNEVSFYDYLCDRISKSYERLSLASRA